MNINDLKPIENNEDKYQEKSQEKYEKYKIDYTNLICCNCKKNKAELIRGTQDYVCVDCFKKWSEKEKKKNFQVFLNKDLIHPVSPGQVCWGSVKQGKDKIADKEKI